MPISKRAIEAFLQKQKEEEKKEEKKDNSIKIEIKSQNEGVANEKESSPQVEGDLEKDFPC